MRNDTTSSAALVAATRVPVQGEPNDDRERIAAILQLRHPGNMYSTCERDADAILAAGFSRATVPDAATELRAERDAAVAAIERVRALHRPLPNSASAMYPEPLCACGSGGYDECQTAAAMEPGETKTAG